MEKLVKVAVDAMGGDHAPGEVVKGAVDAVNEKNNLKVFLVGRIRLQMHLYQLEVQERSLLEDSLLLEGSKGSREHHWEQ